MLVLLVVVGTHARSALCFSSYHGGLDLTSTPSHCPSPIPDRRLANYFLCRICSFSPQVLAAHGRDTERRVARRHELLAAGQHLADLVQPGLGGGRQPRRGHPGQLRRADWCKPCCRLARGYELFVSAGVFPLPCCARLCFSFAKACLRCSDGAAVPLFHSSDLECFFFNFLNSSSPCVLLFAVLALQILSGPTRARHRTLRRARRAHRAAGSDRLAWLPPLVRR